MPSLEETFGAECSPENLLLKTGSLDTADDSLTNGFPYCWDTTIKHRIGGIYPTRIVGRNSLMSPLQLRVDASVRVLTVAYPIVPPQRIEQSS